MNKYVINSIFFALSSFLLVSCDKWIDVSPRLEIREEEYFENELAFQEALNGVYYKMGAHTLYGADMTWGMVDVLGDMYAIDVQGNTSTYPEYLAVYRRDFRAAVVEEKISDIWADAYNCIANLNNLIKNLERADESLFSTKRVKDLLLGEALGLRAFLHFDLLRLFAPVPGGPGSELPVMPYEDTYETAIKPLISVSDVLAKLEGDMSRAEQLLADDPIVHAQVSTPAGMTSRKVKFNYYALKALQARASLWQGRNEEALTAARRVLDVASTRFPWTVPDRVSIAPVSRDRVFSTELIFGLVIDKIEEHTRGIVQNVFQPRTWGTVIDRRYLSLNADKRQEIFETTTAGISDIRNLYLVEEEQSPNTPIATATIYSKLKPALYGADTMSYRMPMLRVSEMYYIAAECLIESQPDEAIRLLNSVRSSRGITVPLQTTLSAMEIQSEIRKEYRKEFTCEGQVLFYRKRKGETNAVLPLPLGELEGR